MKLYLCGDVMLGRAVDQILPYKNSPKLYESFIKDARDYLPQQLKNKTVTYSYVWGDLLKEQLFKEADFRIINLETSVTKNDEPADKAVLYKMHPNNIEVLKVANIDFCCLANNHVLDWKEEGLIET